MSRNIFINSFTNLSCFLPRQKKFLNKKIKTYLQLAKQILL